VQCPQGGSTRAGDATVNAPYGGSDFACLALGDLD